MSLFKDAKAEDFKVLGREEDVVDTEQTVESQEVSEDSEVEAVEVVEATEQGEQTEVAEQVLSFEDEFKQRTEGKYESLDDVLAALDNKSEPQKDYNFKDDFIKDLVDYYDKTGDLTPYLEAKLVDYDAMSSEQVMRHTLKKEYGKLSDKAFEQLYQREVVNKYKLDIDEFDEDEVSLGRELLDVEAGKHKAAYIKEQESFKAPESESKNQEQEIAKQNEQWAKVIGDDSDTKTLETSKNLVWGEDKDNLFNYEVKPEQLVEMAVDNQKFFNLFAGDDGTVNLDKWYRVAAFAQDPDAFVKALITHGKSMGEEKIIDTVKNPSKPQKNKVSTDYDQSDFASGLLNAFSKKVS